MSNLLLSVYVCLRAVLKERRDLARENLALRQQLAVLKRFQTRLKIKIGCSGFGCHEPGLAGAQR
jgi:hypothetical protein